jgi:Ca2+:H+ antiporter
VSFSADGAVAIVFFLHSFLRRFISTPQPPDLLAEARAIDLSIQFLLFWMPVVTLLGWWLNKPMSLLFGNKKMSPRLG